jgi:hypothetical protein
VGYAREAEGAGNVLGESSGDATGVGNGRGCWIESDGRDNLYTQSVRNANWFEGGGRCTLALSKTRNEAP